MFKNCATNHKETKGEAQRRKSDVEDKWKNTAFFRPYS